MREIAIILSIVLFVVGELVGEVATYKKVTTYEVARDCKGDRHGR